MIPVTLFTTCKPFDRSHIAVIQNNAIRSWLRAFSEDSEIFLFDTQEQTFADGARGIIRQYKQGPKITYFTNIPSTPFGTPLLNAMFDQALLRSKNNVFIYSNADIILFDKINEAISMAVNKFDDFMVGISPRNLKITDEIDFGDPCWREGLEKRAKSEEGSQRGPCAIDTFIFTRNVAHRMPKFSAGRVGFDNWLIHNAIEVTGGNVVNATKGVLTVHQDHDYKHLKRGDIDRYEGPEAAYNRQLCGKSIHFHNGGKGSLAFAPYVYDGSSLIFRKEFKDHKTH